ncbi:MAG: carboxyl-terminal processing protease [Candidatus Latescibacterota bacterium]|jgi:carboxyl-terminal processing protease
MSELHLIRPSGPSAKESALRFSLLILLSFLPALTPPVHAAPSIDQEYKTVLWPIAQRIHEFYFEELSPDTLMLAAARGLFAAMDPASEYDIDTDAMATAAPPRKLLANRFTTLMQVAKSLDEQAFYHTPADTLIRFGIAGMMQILDPYSVHLEKRNLDNFNIQTQGKYGGLGFRIQVVRPDSAIAVWSLLHDATPAARAGIKSGDLIIAIDGESTKELSAGDAADKMRGEPGTPVTLTLRRAGVDEPFDLSIVREEVHMGSIAIDTLFPDSTGYVKLDRFQRNCSDELRDSLLKLREQGMKRIILDLRGNGGGYLDEAVDIVDLFLPEERMVVFTAGRAFRDTTKYLTSRPALFTDEPMIVLVNGQSASASEIVAGAIQDWDRGLVLGSSTVGKGSVQQVVPIDEHSELKLTMAAWHTPAGRSIDRRMRKDSTLVSDPSTVYTTLMLERIVRGGGGIAPDIKGSTRKGNRLWWQLSGFSSLNNQFFNYARQYQVAHPELTPDFRADEKTLKEFRSFSAAREFDYVSEAEAHVHELEEVAQGDDFKELEKPIKNLIEKIDKVEEGHWKENEELILWRLTYAILEKAFGVKQAEGYNVTVDPQIDEALAVLAVPADYEQWFQVEEVGIDSDDSVAQDDDMPDIQ